METVNKGIGNVKSDRYTGNRNGENKWWKLLFILCFFFFDSYLPIMIVRTRSLDFPKYFGR